MNEALIQQQQEELLKNYVISNYDQSIYDELIKSFNSLNQYLHDQGVRRELFTGVFNPNQLSRHRTNSNDSSPANNFLCNAQGITPHLIGTLVGSDLIGPFIHPINHNAKPFVPRSMGFKIERADGHYLTYGIMDHVKAVLMYYGDNPLTSDGETIMDLLKTDEEIDFSAINFGRDKHCLEVRLEGYYGGHAFEGKCDSASNHDTISHDISIRQPWMIKNNKYYCPNNSVYKSTAKITAKKFNERPEFRKNNEPDKYAVMAMIALKMGTNLSKNLGHNITIEVPENRPVSSLDGLIINNERLELLTLYDAIVSPFKNNELFCHVIGDAVNWYYNHGLPEREVDYKIAAKYGLNILSPRLKWDSIIHQASMQERFKYTATLMGSVIKRRGEEPEPIIKDIITPFSLSKITIHNLSGETKALMHFEPARDFKLHKCWTLNPNPLFNGCQFWGIGNYYSTGFGGYYRKNKKQKPKVITELEGLPKKVQVNWQYQGATIIEVKINPLWLNVPAELFESGMPSTPGQFNPDFYEHPEDYQYFFKQIWGRINPNKEFNSNL